MVCVIELDAIMINKTNGCVRIASRDGKPF